VNEETAPTGATPADTPAIGGSQGAPSPYSPEGELNV
jgi:hypothetical protein